MRLAEAEVASSSPKKIPRSPVGAPAGVEGASVGVGAEGWEALGVGAEGAGHGIEGAAGANGAAGVDGAAPVDGAAGVDGAGVDAEGAEALGEGAGPGSEVSSSRSIVPWREGLRNRPMPSTSWNGRARFLVSLNLEKEERHYLRSHMLRTGFLE